MDRPSPAAVVSAGYPSWTVLTITPVSAQATVLTYDSRPRVNQVMATAVPRSREDGCLAQHAAGS